MSGLAIGLAALAAAGAPCPPPAVSAPPANGPAYNLIVHVHRGLREADGTETVAFRPGVATGRVVLRLWANGPAYARDGASLAVRAVTSGGRTVPTSRPNPTTLVVRRRLAAGQRLVVRLRWALVLPRGSGGRMHGGGGTMRLASFFPLLAWDGLAWRTDPPTAVDIGETWTSPAADFDVRVMHPSGLRVLATGTQVAPG